MGYNTRVRFRARGSCRSVVSSRGQRVLSRSSNIRVQRRTDTRAEAAQSPASEKSEPRMPNPERANPSRGSRHAPTSNRSPPVPATPAGSPTPQYRMWRGDKATRQRGDMRWNGLHNQPRSNRYSIPRAICYAQCIPVTLGPRRGTCTYVSTDPGTVPLHDFERERENADRGWRGRTAPPIEALL